MSDTEAGIAELTALVARLQGLIISREAAATAVQQLALVARDMVPSAVGAGASLIDSDGTAVSTATTDRVAEIADDLQYELGQGPCLSAWATTSVQRLDDTAADTRWPEWSAAAGDLGIRSVVSAPLVFRGDAIGALKVYSTAAGAFTPDDERRLVLLTTSAATLLGLTQRADGPQRASSSLSDAMSHRQAIDVAVGILMERHGLDEESARQRLLDASREEQVPMVEVALHVRDEQADPADAE